ncbi:MAG: hypothetical protein QXO75_09535 [Nitrososphaerota archaeon]
MLNAKEERVLRHLEELGLPSYQAKAYFSCLVLGRPKAWELARYRSRGSRYRGARYRRYRNPYRFSKYNPYRARSKYLSPYARRGQDYESEPSEERTHYSLPQNQGTHKSLSKQGQRLANKTGC